MAEENRPNVLMIAVDDLRTELGCLGESHIVSPNIDRLAAIGLRFDRAYCMVPTCGASRASLFSGRRPSPNRFISYTACIDEDSPKSKGLHKHSKQAGYRTASLDKILNYPADQSEAWSESPRQPNRSEPTITESILG